MVIPAIRKTGAYNTKAQYPDDFPQHDNQFQYMHDLIDAQKITIRQRKTISINEYKTFDLLKDFAQILIANTTLTDQKIADLMDPFTEKDVRLTDTNGDSQKRPIINESGIYVLILRIPTPASGAKSLVFDGSQPPILSVFAPNRPFWKIYFRCQEMPGHTRR